MADSLQTPIASQTLILKVKNTLDRVAGRISSIENPTINKALGELNSAFKQFFDTLGDPEFKPEYFLTGDTARSESYNNNLRMIYNDLDRFYKEIKTLTDAQLKSYNFSSVLVNEITSRANGLASIVLDLNILSNFDRGDVIVAGDDFKTLDYVDLEAPVASSTAELLPNGSGVGLARDGASSVLKNSKIEVIPLSPSNASNGQGTVNTDPTPGNIERFYEGNYYNFLGLARPEGGRFNIKFLLKDPGQESQQGIFVDLGGSTTDKNRARLNSIDGDAATFWECEYLYKSPESLVPDIVDSVVIDNESTVGNEGNQFSSGTVNIDLEEAERRALEFDTAGRDLLIDLILTLNSPTNVNFVAVNPVIFGSQAFPEIEDIATSSTNDGEFITVDGWDRIRFAKTITPEVNEFLTDSQLGATLAPSRASYLGQGIYPFPVRIAKKVKLRIRMRVPVASPYERTYILLKRTVNVESTITTTTTKGAFSF